MRLLNLFRSAAALSVLLASASTGLANPILLFEPETGAIIQQEDVYRRWHPASLTKLMTAYVAFKALKDGELALNSPIKVSKKALRQPPSKMGYPVGSVMTANNALIMMLVKSANDIAMAVAENVGGSEQAFVARMNAEAKRLGMTDTNFVNPTGLNADAQYTSARDLALLVSALRRDFPERMGYFSIEGIVAGKRTFENFNALVGRYPGADGMKTGYICDSGFNLIGSATRQGRTLVAIVLGEKSVTARAEKAASLLDQGFASARGSATLAGLERPSDRVEGPANLRSIMCPKPVPGQKPVEEGAENAKAETPSPYQMPFDHAPTLVKVELGGADGPVPTGKLDAEGKEFADVPLPIWRPDMPDPTAPASQVLPGQGDAPPAAPVGLRP